MSCINEQSPDSYYQGFALVAGGGFRTPPASNFRWTSAQRYEVFLNLQAFCLKYF
nr:MAG TPA: hypothetical protein [Caudoviricetes sp.]